MGVPAVMNGVTSSLTPLGGAVPTLTTNGTPVFDEWFGIEGIDYTGDGDVYDNSGPEDPADNWEYSYLNTTDWMISSPDGTAFTSGASFNFSMDGQQYSGTLAPAIAATAAIPALVVPESATIIIAVLGLLGMGWLGRRRRKRA